MTRDNLATLALPAPTSTKAPARFDLLDAQRAVFASSLSAHEKLVAMALLAHWSAKSPAPFPSIRRLAKMASLCERTTRKAVRALELAGAITANHRPGRSKQFL